jgi:hypothetical protein
MKTYLNGTLTNNIVLDTTQAATDTIDYLATDQTGTSTRTVVVEASSIIPPTTHQPPPPPLGRAARECR